MTLSVIIPAYNEHAVIESTLKDVSQYLRKRSLSHEIIVVDDGSRDATAAKVRSFTDITLISLEQNRGKGNAVRRGMLAAKGDLVLFMDADNSTNIRELDHFLDEIRSFDIVIGSRTTVGSNVAVSQNIVKKISGRLGNFLIRSVLGLVVNDTQCGFKLFTRKALEVFKYQTIDRWGFDFEILYLAQKRGLRVHESPVTWVNNFDSKVRSSDYMSVLSELLRVRWTDLTGGYRHPRSDIVK